MSKTLRQLVLAVALTASLSAVGASARAANDAEPLYTATNQYTAVLDQAHQHWQIRPAEGAIVDIQASDCHAGATIPAGLWLLVSEADGQAELVAPSATILPAGAPDHVALRDCNAGNDGSAIAVPQSVIELLKANTGAIYVQQ